MRGFDVWGFTAALHAAGTPPEQSGEVQGQGWQSQPQLLHAPDRHVPPSTCVDLVFLNAAQHPAGSMRAAHLWQLSGLRPAVRAALSAA